MLDTSHSWPIMGLCRAWLAMVPTSHYATLLFGGPSFTTKLPIYVWLLCGRVCVIGGMTH